MKNIPYNGYRGIRLPKQIQQQRLEEVIRTELTEKQRQTLLAYYIQGKTLQQIAQEQGVNRSTVWRSLKRAEERLRRFLRY